MFHHEFRLTLLLAYIIMYAMKKNIGQIIRQRREELGWSQAHLAQVTGYSRLYVLKIENNQIKNPGIAAVKKIFGALGLKLDVI
jgi:transcriptional regulator with XRE-family HTH domain